MDLFLDFHHHGVTVLIATHDQRSIARLNKRVLSLSHGGNWRTTASPPPVEPHCYENLGPPPSRSAARKYRTPAAHAARHAATIAVIGITLALPGGLYLAVDNTRQLARGWEANGQVSLF